MQAGRQSVSRLWQQSRLSCDTAVICCATPSSLIAVRYMFSPDAALPVSMACPVCDRGTYFICRPDCLGGESCWCNIGLPSLEACTEYDKICDCQLYDKLR